MNALRWQTAIGHGGVILWQLYSTSVAWRGGAILQRFLTGLGATPGPGAALFIATCRWWIVVPIVSAVLSFQSIRMIESKPSFAVAVLAGEISVALILNVWWREAFFGTMFSLMGSLG
jgi:hypothetical protein